LIIARQLKGKWNKGQNMGLRRGSSRKEREKGEVRSPKKGRERVDAGKGIRPFLTQKKGKTDSLLRVREEEEKSSCQGVIHG